jgi:hypothetical protein
VIDKPKEPAVEQELEIAGNKYTALGCPQWLPHGRRWDNNRNVAELYNVALADLGNDDFFVCSF